MVAGGEGADESRGRAEIIEPTTEDRPRVVIIGGGFGGLEAARRLRRAPVRVIVVDRRNHHLFQPLLYQVATAALNPSDIAAPIRRVLRHQANAEVVLAEATGIDVAARTVLLADGVLAYDYLILATGASHSYFGRDDWARFAPGLKSVEDALDIRRRILFAFEAAEREADPARRAAWLRFVVVGAGPTGVELAGALSEIARHALARDFRHIDPKQAHVILLEGTPRVLPSYDDDLSEKAREQLVRMGVDVRTGLMVTEIDDHGVSLGPERIEARTVLWAAGVVASPLAKTLGVPLDRAGRVLVEPDLTIPGHAEVYVIGDLAHFEQEGSLVPGVAPAAIQEARHAVANILRTLENRPRLAVPLSRQGVTRDDRPRGRRRRPARRQALGMGGLGGLAVRPHLLPDRVPEPLHRALRMGVVVLHLRSRRPAHHREPEATGPDAAGAGFLGDGPRGWGGRGR